MSDEGKGEGKEKIVLDEEKGLAFESEEEAAAFFSKHIRELEEELLSARSEDDIPIEDFDKYDECLAEALQDPDEIWRDSTTFDDYELSIYIADFEAEDTPFTYIVIAYMGSSGKSFVFLHFPTFEDAVIDKFRRGHKEYEKGINFSTEVEMDALSSGDEFAVGLFEAMLTLRNDKDIPQEEFESYLRYREEAIEEADEIWRKTDSQGHVLVNFIKEFEDPEGDFFYIVVSLEEQFSESHYILFSFPTNDKGLVGRYRQGENLDSEAFVKEESH